MCSLGDCGGCGGGSETFGADGGDSQAPSVTSGGGFDSIGCFGPIVVDLICLTVTCKFLLNCINSAKSSA